MEMVRDRGFEPLTPSVSRKCSTTELTAQPESTLVNFLILSVMLRVFKKMGSRATRFCTSGLEPGFGMPHHYLIQSLLGWYRRLAGGALPSLWTSFDGPSPTVFAHVSS